MMFLGQGFQQLEDRDIRHTDKCDRMHSHTALLGRDHNAKDITSSEQITLEAVDRAVDKLKHNKAAGLDEILAELLKHGSDVIATVT